MKRIVTIVAVGLLLAAVSLQAQETQLVSQENVSTNRIQKQHNYTQFQKTQMKASEASILAAMNSQSVGLQQTAMQTLRDLEQLDPDYPFGSLIAPLGEKLLSEQTDPTVRVLAALALDELHSNAGDAIIRAVAEKSQNPDVQNLCRALLVRSDLK